MNPKNKIDITAFIGERFGMLTVTSEGPQVKVGKVKGTSRTLFARCDCGKEIQRILAPFLRRPPFSCGCVHNSLIANGVKRHGGRYIPEYAIWNSMHARCENPKNESWKYYGARGIRVCERWEEFPAFIADMGRKPSSKHSIDRIDSDKNYQPDNCRWATQKEQQNNRRNNRKLIIDGLSLNLCQWAEKVGIDSKRIDHRLRLGWSEKDAVYTPIGASKNSISRLDLA